MDPMTVAANPKIQELISLLRDPEVYDVFQELVLRVLCETKGPQVIPRLNNIEAHLGANEDWCIWKDVRNEGREVLMPLTEQFDLISGRIEDVSLPVLKETVYSGNDTEIRAKYLKDELSDFKLRNGKRFMTSKEVQEYLVNRIYDKYKSEPGDSARKAAYDVMKKAVEMFPKVLKLGKNKKGLNIIEFIGNR